VLVLQYEVCWWLTILPLLTGPLSRGWAPTVDRGPSPQPVCPHQVHLLCCYGNGCRRSGTLPVSPAGYI